MTKTQRWMNANWRDYVDDLDGQLNCTRMAEGAADFAENAIAEERHFEEAHDVATQLERAGLVNPRCPSMHNNRISEHEH